MRTNRKNSHDNRRGDSRRFSSNDGYENRNGNRTYRDQSYTNGYSGADSERYPVSRGYDDYDENDFDDYNTSSYNRGGDHREWDSKGYSHFDRSSNDDFRSRNQRGNSGMYGSSDDDYRSQNRRSDYRMNDNSRSSNASGSSQGHNNDYLGEERRNRSYRSSMGNHNNGFGEYDIDHEERDNRNSSLYNSERPESHRGKGPKGYKRSDDRMKEDISDRLSDDHSLDASEIEVEVKNGEVILSGTVTDRSDKRRAEDLVESVSGVSNVENRIRVSSAGSSKQSGSSGSGRSSSRGSSR